MRAKATVHGAISIVNAIATGRGATLGTDRRVTAVAEASPGSGITVRTEKGVRSSRLIDRTVQRIIPKKTLERNRVCIGLESDVPTGYGLKTSSAISSAVALACARLFDIKTDERRILLAGVSASVETGVSVTGAYDDVCACCYGGFNVTDNRKRRLVVHRDCPGNMTAVIFIPSVKKRGNIRRLKTLGTVFGTAWDLAKDSDYWGAMTLNGLATAAALKSDPGIVTGLLEAGAVGASVSGNGPAIAAVTRQGNLSGVKGVFSGMDGRTLVARINNRRADVRGPM